MNKVFDDARRLSSGTLATLIGRGDYATLDKVNEAFLGWLPPIAGRFFTWQSAWLEFAKSGRLCTVLGVTQPNREEINAG